MTDTLDRTQEANGGSAAWHLRGNFAPVFDEVELPSLEVIGAIPPTLDGVYLRNGPNPQSGSSPHWFLGNGMLHGVRLRAGRAEWYRNRYVRTTRFENPDAPPEPGFRNRLASSANTHVVCHAGRILALEEGHFPWQVDERLNTVGAHDFGGRLTTAMTAHPKICPETGEMMFFGYGQLPPYLTYHRVDASGELVQSTEVQVKGPTMMHDFNVTRNFVVFMDLPVVFDLDLAMKGTMPYLWDDDYGARLGVMARDGSSTSVQWFDIDPCYVFHPMNSYERVGRNGTEIVLDVARFQSMWRKGSEEFDNVALLHRWVSDLTAGTVREALLDDRPAEFARVADDVIGLPNRFGYMTATRPGNGDAVFSTELFKYDMSDGSKAVHQLGEGRCPGEGVFATDTSAGIDRAEDDGWVLTYVHDAASDTSELVIVDAKDFAAPPVARIKIGRRIPFGFHGSWVPAELLG